MKNLKIIIITLLLIAINSCKKEDKLENTREYTPEIIQEEYGRARVVGFVKDKAGEPLYGVRVYFGEHESITDGEGKFELREVSEGSNKRIWFEKDGFVSTQKLINVREDLPNRVDAAIFPVGATAKMTDEGGLIEGDDFSIKIQSGGFVYSDGEIVTGEVTVSATPFLNSEEEFFDTFPGNFEGRREDGSNIAIESFGFIDVDLRDEAGELVQLAEGVTATIQIKAPENAPQTIPMWYYDFNKAEWIEEGTGTLENGNYTAEVTHFTPWNWDLPVELQSTIIGRVVDNQGNPIEGAKISQSGLNRAFSESTYSSEDGTFEMTTLEDLELELEAQFDIYGSTEIERVITNNETDIGDIVINSSSDNVQSPIISNSILLLTIGRSTKIMGSYFGEEKKDGYKLLLNNDEIETTLWQNNVIEFLVPDGIAEEGAIQIERNGYLSKTLSYIEDDWFCEIDGSVLFNDDLKMFKDEYLLDLRFKSLIEIPSCIGKLRKLEKLDLIYNELHTLPESIGDLNNLEKIYAGNNQLTSLPATIGNLSNLKVLALENNNLRSLPESIKYLSNSLEHLNLENNPIFGHEKAKIESWLPNTFIFF